MCLTGYDGKILKDKIKKGMIISICNEWFKKLDKSNDHGGYFQAVRELPHSMESAMEIERRIVSLAVAPNSSSYTTTRAPKQTTAWPPTSASKVAKKNAFKDKKVFLAGIPTNFDVKGFEKKVYIRSGDNSHTCWVCLENSPVFPKTVSISCARKSQQEESDSEPENSHSFKLVVSSTSQSVASLTSRTPSPVPKLINVLTNCAELEIHIYD